MRKSTKLAILVAALVALCSIAALAADTWKQDGDNWYCYDSDGNMYYGKARKSGNNYYYLDSSTGAMVTDQLVEDPDDGYTYYYGADGARVIDQWVKVAVDNSDGDNDGWEYMYFKAVSGRAQVSTASDPYKLYTIGGKKYSFNDKGWMRHGYVTSDGSSTTYASAAEYFFGEKEDGSAQTGWVNVLDGADEKYDEDASVWFYFNKGVKKYYKGADALSNSYVKYNGNKYYFDENGAMITGWTAATWVNASTSEYVYLGAADDGVLKKSQWIKSAKDFGPEDGDTNYWYYLKKDGTRQPAGVAKINSKYYLFDGNRHMLSGIVASSVLTADKSSPLNFAYSKANTTTATNSLDDYKTLSENVDIMYFSADADTDGSMKTGTQTVTIDGEEATIVFDKHGYALEGYVSKKIYQNGILQSAGTSKAAVKKLRKYYSDTFTVGYYLVNASGTLLKSTYTTDSDGIYWAVKNYRENYKFADTDYAAKAAQTVKGLTTAPVEGTTGVYFTVTEDSTTVKYNLTFTAVKDDDGIVKYYDVKWAK